jgi:hypothetical protein
VAPVPKVIRRPLNYRHLTDIAAALPEMTQTGDLPTGIYSANWREIEDRFGHGTEARVRAFQKLRRLYKLAHRSGNLSRFLVFGSFVSTVADPRDVDIVLIMKAGFVLENAPRECRTLFSHADAEARYGASVFWIRAGMACGERFAAVPRYLADETR